MAAVLGNQTYSENMDIKNFIVHFNLTDFIYYIIVNWQNDTISKYIRWWKMLF